MKTSSSGDDPQSNESESKNYLCNLRNETNEKIRVLLPAINLLPGLIGGAERYIRSLLDEFKNQSQLDVTLGISRDASELLEVYQCIELLPKSFGHSNIQRLFRLCSTELYHSKISKKMSDFEVIHFPLTAAIPLLNRNQKFIVTVHDLQQLDLPDLFSPAVRAYRHLYFESSIKRAERIIAVSEFTKNRLVAHFDIPKEKIDVIPSGVNLDLFIPSTRSPEEYILYPANAWPHKNHKILFDAMFYVRCKFPKMRLILTGINHVDLMPLPDYVESKGLVEERELVDLYGGAACLVFPSLYEGFGFPAIEAMAAGCPVAASYAGSLPEICGTAAVFFNPNDPRDIARGIIEAIDKRDILRVAGFVQVQKYSWKEVARLHSAVYQRVATSETT